MRLLLLLGLCTIAPGAVRAQTASTADSATFDFLLGAWEIAEERLGDDAPTHPVGETFVFERAPAGPGLISWWRINRGTESVPDFSDALYVHAYDRETARWSFYYASDRSAQFYEGRREGSGWTVPPPVS